MSFAIAMAGSDGIVMAADCKESLDSAGEFQSHNAHKLIEITDGVWLSCVSNYPGFTNRIISDFINKVREIDKKGQQWDIISVSKLFQIYANTEWTAPLALDR